MPPAPASSSPLFVRSYVIVNVSPALTELGTSLELKLTAGCAATGSETTERIITAVSARAVYFVVFSLMYR